MARGVAVVLFTDLVGSTQLRARVGEAAAEELRRNHDRTLTQPVEANSGHVVKGLGDGIMATFSEASAAIAAAVAIQQAVDRLNRTGKAPVPLAVRVGLSAGDVTFEDDDVHGTPVIEAARLCNLAAGGEILASEMVRWLARGSAAAFTPVGELELKGLPEAVPAVRVEWEPLATSAIPMPNLLTAVGRIFVGRDAELERLGQLWKEAAAGERRVALLAGEPGVGKTRLAAELAIRVHDEGGVVLAGRCDEDLGVPYQPFVEALRHFVDHTPPVDLRVRLGRYGGELVRLVPELAERVTELPPPLQSDPETERYRLFDAVAAWLAAASADEPVLLVLDDLQWAAKPTLLLLRHIVRAPDVRRLFILGTYRDTELTHDHPLVELVADLRREGALERLPLSGLDDVAVAAIVEQAAGQTLDEDGLALARAIYQETEGNPFFVREVLRHLDETKAIERQGDVRTRVPIERLGIPEGVRDVVGRRLARLSEDANHALRVAAVVGAEFDASLVQAAGELAESTLLAALDEAIEARLLTEVSGTRFRFSHALVRATLYESLTDVRKVALHRHVAEAIEVLQEGQLDDFLPALAHHWAKASVPADTKRAVEYARRAGDRALAQLAHDEAAAYYQQALEFFDGPSQRDQPLRLELQISLGEAQRRAGDPTHRDTLLQASRLARACGDAAAMARAALANSRGMFSSTLGRVDADRVEALQSALDAVPGSDSPTRARLLATLAQELLYAGDRPRRIALSDEALAIARRLGDLPTLAEVLLARYYTVAAPPTLGERMESTRELLAIAEVLSDDVTRSRALALRFRVAMECGDVEEADRCLAANEDLVVELRQPTLRWYAAVQRAARTLLAGQIAEGERLAQVAAAVGRAASQEDADHILLWQQTLIRFEQDRLGELTNALGQYASTYPSITTLPVIMAEAYCDAGRHREAREILDRLGRSGFDLFMDSVWLRGVTGCASVASHLAATDHAATLYGMLLLYAAQLPTFSFGTVTASVSHFLGLLSDTLQRFDDADTHFAVAATIHARIAAPTLLARTHLEWARMLLTRRQPGDADRARELVRQALATARDLGLGSVERKAVALAGQLP